MSEIKTKDFFIFKLNYYADKKVLDRWHAYEGLPVPAQHIERAQLSNDFLWALAEKVTNKKQKEWREEFLFDTIECALEEMAETHQIYRWLFRDGWYTYFIPKKHEDIISWVIKNIKSPYKILKRSGVGHIHRKSTSRHLRDGSKKSSDIFKHKVFLFNNTRRVLVEKDESLKQNKKYFA